MTTVNRETMNQKYYSCIKKGYKILGFRQTNINGDSLVFATFLKKGDHMIMQLLCYNLRQYCSCYQSSGHVNNSSDPKEEVRSRYKFKQEVAWQYASRNLQIVWKKVSLQNQTFWDSNQCTSGVKQYSIIQFSGRRSSILDPAIWLWRSTLPLSDSFLRGRGTPAGQGTDSCPVSAKLTRVKKFQQHRRRHNWATVLVMTNQM